MRDSSLFDEIKHIKKTTSAIHMARYVTESMNHISVAVMFTQPIAFAIAWLILSKLDMDTTFAIITTAVVIQAISLLLRYIMIRGMSTVVGSAILEKMGEEDE